MEILLHYRQLFVQGNVFIGEWGVFGAEVFLCYSQFFIKGDFIIGGVECTEHVFCIEKVQETTQTGDEIEKNNSEHAEDDDIGE